MKPSKPKGTFPFNSTGGYKSVRKSDQDNNSGKDDKTINEEAETEKPYQPLPRPKRNCKHKPILTMVDWTCNPTLIDNH